MASTAGWVTSVWVSSFAIPLSVTSSVDSVKMSSLSGLPSSACRAWSALAKASRTMFSDLRIESSMLTYWLPCPV